MHHIHWPDTWNIRRQIAEAKAKQIESDIIYERFDPSLAKYRPEHFKLAETKDEAKNAPKLDELWAKFIEYKRPQCSPSTMVNQYRYQIRRTRGCNAQKQTDVFAKARPRARISLHDGAICRSFPCSAILRYAIWYARRHAWRVTASYSTLQPPRTQLR